MNNLCEHCFNPCREDCNINNPKSNCEDFMGEECSDYSGLCYNKGTDVGCLKCEHYNKNCPVEEAYQNETEEVIKQMAEENYGYISNDCPGYYIED